MEEVTIKSPSKSKLRQTGLKAVLIYSSIILYLSYILQFKVECSPSLDSWLVKLRIIFSVLLFCGVASWINLGQAIKNTEKILKFLSAICGIGYAFYGTYLVYVDENCQQVWSAAFYTVLISVIFVWASIALSCLSISCLLVTAYMNKHKDD